MVPELEQEATQVAGSIQFSRVLEPDSETAPDITLASYNPVAPLLPPGNAVVFLEHRIKQKPVLERKVLETGQPLDLHLPPQAEPAPLRIAFRSWDGANNFEIEAPHDDAARQRAPIYPGYVTVRHGDQAILEASTFFADTREADLSRAASDNQLDGAEKSLVARHTEEDINWAVWVLLLALVLVLS